MNKRGHIPEEEAPIMMNQVISAVKQWHKSGVIHWDIKDENILVTVDELSNTQIKLIDFGAAAVFEDKVYSNLCGTNVYSPPEWINNKFYQGKSATVWSLDILLHSLVVGNIPFLDRDQVLAHVLNIPQHLTLSNACHELIKWYLQGTPCDRPTLDQIANHLWFEQEE